MGMSMTVTLSELNVLAEFDRRVFNGVIHYDNNPDIQVQEVDGYKFEFAVTEAISKKPYIKGNNDEPNGGHHARRPSRPGYFPGSDIDVSGYEIADVTDTHCVAFNKFCMYRPHLLLLTKDGYRRQYDILSLDDMEASRQMLEAMNWHHFMFFNCGKDGGCSRLHKHMQLAPLCRNRLKPWPETTAGDVAPAKIPYQYILRRFEGDLGPKQIHDLYGQMMIEARKILGLDPRSPEHVPHNVALGRNWILVIPRRKAGVKGAYANTLGLLGMISVANEAELRCWLDQGAVEVLKQLGVPQ
ncbi:phosphorylase [Apiospora arundinis]